MYYLSCKHTLKEILNALSIKKKKQTMHSTQRKPKDKSKTSKLKSWTTTVIKL